MMKWFRKHNKQLLAVFASALLVIWLGGSAVQRLFERDRFNETLGTAMGHKITGVGNAALKAKLGVMEGMGLPWSAPWVNPAVQQQLAPLGEREVQMAMMTMGQPLNRDKGTTDWWLLDLEARKMGVTVSQQQVEDFLRNKHVSGADLAKVRDMSQMSTDEIFETVGEYLRVTQAAVLASAGVQVSDAEIKDLFVKTHDQLNVRYAVLPAQEFEKATDTQPATEAIPEAELQTLFDKYRDQMAGAGQYGFGYKIPDREKIQYVGASVDAIVGTLPAVPDERARKYFEQHKTEFEPPRPPTTQPTTQPAVTFEEVKDRVIDRIKKQEASQVLRQAVEDIRATAWGEYTGAKADLAADKVPPTLAKVLEQKAQDLQQSKRLPLTYHETPLISQEQARSEAGIGIAGSVGTQGQAVDFATAAFNLSKGESDSKEGKESQEKRDEKLLQISRYQPVVVRSQSGDQLNSAYVFRVVGFEPAHAPTSLAEVRGQVERDARTLRALKKAEEAARKMAKAAEGGNLNDVFKAQFASAATQPATTQPYGTGMKILEQPALTQAQYVQAQTVLQFDAMRKMYNVNMQGPTDIASPFRLSGVTGAEPVVKACFDMAGPATTSQPVNKVTVLELPDQKAWVVAQVVEHNPAKDADFALQRNQIAGDLRILKLRDFYSSWFKPEDIRKRTGWQPANGMQAE